MAGRNGGRGEDRLAIALAAIAEGFARFNARFPPEERERQREARRRKEEERKRQRDQEAREKRAREEERRARLEWERVERQRLHVADAIAIRPAPDPAIRQQYRAWPARILDERTGFVLSKPIQSTVQLPREEHLLSQWQVDRPELPPLYVLTREGSADPHALVPVPAVEIVLAWPDGFFPFEEALMPEDLPMDRIAAMIDLQGSKEGARGLTYYDNRRAYREKNREWARMKARCPFRTANLDVNLVERGAYPVYFPVAGGAVYDAGTQTVTAADGSTLHSDNERWYTGIDRDGGHDRVHATWTDATGKHHRRITMMPQRGWRPGYGETRAVIAITRKYEWDHESVPPADGIAAPTGEQLAELVNLAVPIAGEHAGHMILIDARAAYADWR